MSALFKCIIIFVSLLFAGVINAAQRPLITLNLRDAYLTEAISLVAHALKTPVYLSPQIMERITVNIKNADAKDFFDMLLASHHLTKVQHNSLFYVAPQSEVLAMQKQQQELAVTHELTLPIHLESFGLKYASAAHVADALYKPPREIISKRGNLTVDKRTNAVIVQDDLPHLTKIRKMIRVMDVPLPQILIHAKLISIDSDFERELGLNLGAGVAKNEPAAVMGQYSLAIVKLANSSLFDVKLSALENKGHAELISNPSLYTANQQTAFIEAGEEVPYQETTKEGGTAIVFKKAVLGLKVTPQVLPGNNILLQLEITQNRPSNKMVLGMPTISTRQIVSSVLVKNGQTVVLGGIYEANDEIGHLSIPFLNRIPWLGQLATQRKTRKNKRELLVFVKPIIMAH